jgi:hypothetical protein
MDILGLWNHCDLLSFRTSILANRDALDKHDQGQQSEANYQSGIASRLTAFLNWLSGILFVSGVTLAALFLSRKL